MSTSQHDVWSNLPLLEHLRDAFHKCVPFPTRIPTCVTASGATCPSRPPRPHDESPYPGLECLNGDPSSRPLRQKRVKLSCSYFLTLPSANAAASVCWETPGEKGENESDSQAPRASQKPVCKLHVAPDTVCSVPVTKRHARRRARAKTDTKK